MRAKAIGWVCMMKLKVREAKQKGVHFDVPFMSKHWEKKKLWVPSHMPNFYQPLKTSNTKTIMVGVWSPKGFYPQTQKNKTKKKRTLILSIHLMGLWGPIPLCKSL